MKDVCSLVAEKENDNIERRRFGVVYCRKEQVTQLSERGVTTPQFGRILVK